METNKLNKKIFLTIGAVVLAIVLGLLLHYILAIGIVAWAIWIIWYKPYKEHQDLLKRLGLKK